MTEIFKILRTEEYIAQLRSIVPLDFQQSVEDAVDRLAEHPYRNKSRLKDSFLFKHEISKYRILYYVNNGVLEVWTVYLLKRKDDYEEIDKIEYKFKNKYPEAFRKK